MAGLDPATQPPRVRVARELIARGAGFAMQSFFARRRSLLGGLYVVWAGLLGW
jgi:hypothetical protein